MKSLLIVLFLSSVTANEFTWMYEKLDRPINWTIMHKDRYDINWEKACGDPHAMFGDSRFDNDSICFDFGMDLPGTTKVSGWRYKGWDIRLLLTKKIPTNTGLEVNHDFIDEAIIYFDGKERVRATKYEGVHWPSPALNPNPSDNNLEEVTWADSFTYTRSDYKVELANSVVTFTSEPNNWEKYVFQIYENGTLVIEMREGYSGGALTGVVGRFHEYRIFKPNSDPSIVGDRAVAQVNSDNDKVFEVEKIVHHTVHQKSGGKPIPNECWHPVSFVDPNKYSDRLNDFVI